MRTTFLCTFLCTLYFYGTNIYIDSYKESNESYCCNRVFHFWNYLFPLCSLCLHVLRFGVCAATLLRGRRRTEGLSKNIFYVARCWAGEGTQTRCQKLDYTDIVLLCRKEFFQVI